LTISQTIDYINCVSIETEELKKKILELVREDEDFAMELNRAILRLYSDKLLTKTYLDEALAKQSKEFDEKLIKLREELSKDFDEKLAKQSKEFDEKLAKQSKEFDEKFNKWADNIIERMTNKINAIGGRWGIDAENAVRKFAEKIVSDWGGNVKKWNKKVEIKLGDKVIHKEYEIDIVVKDGKEILIEVKASFNKDSMERFVEACELYESSEGKGKKTERVAISFFIYEEAKEIANKNKVTIITN